MCRDVRLSAITGELGLGNFREATDDQVRAVQESLALAGVGELTAKQLEVMRSSLARTLVDKAGMPVHSRRPVLAGAI